MKQKIMADTSVWIEYFKNNPKVVNFMEKNLLSDNIYTIGIIIAELIQGIKNEDDRKLVRLNMDAVAYIELTYKDWIKAGELSSSLRKKGITLPLTDIAIASAAFEYKMELATLDKHFETIPGLKISKMS